MLSSYVYYYLATLGEAFSRFLCLVQSFFTFFLSFAFLVLISDLILSLTLCYGLWTMGYDYTYVLHVYFETAAMYEYQLMIAFDHANQK